MARRTLAHGVPPTAAERKADEARNVKVKAELMVLERAARRHGVPFDGSALSVWNLALMLEKRLAPLLKKK